MKIECLHGYFRFEEDEAGQLAQFSSLFGFDLVRSGDHFTFEDLDEAPDYSIAGGTFLGVPTLSTFEGRPWEVMRENRLVYDFGLGLVVPIDSVITPVKIATAGNFFVSSGMILPGSLTEDGDRVTDYSARFIRDRMNFKYSEVSVE